MRRLAGAVALIVVRKVGSLAMVAAFAGGGCCFVLRVVAAALN